MNDFNQESETREFKKSLSELKEGLVSIAAMLNKHGHGELWFGIAPNGKVAGMDINEKTLRDVSQAIAAHIEPTIYPSISRQTVDGKYCLKVAAEGWQMPYFAYGRAYIRVADEDRKLSASELKSFILQNNRDALRWEDEPSGLTLEQLNIEKINSFLARAGLSDDAPASALQKLDLLAQQAPNNAAKLFFTEHPIQLRCAVFATTTSSTIIDRQDFAGDLLELIDEAEKYVLKNIHIGMRLEGLYRVDVPEVPTKAVREAVVNAFCHRDWRDPDYVQVAVFKDRVEIRSPGTLYGNLTFEEIIQGNVSRRRNPKIAELLRRVHLVESWGRGVPLILESAPATEFTEIGGIFITRFKRLSTVETKGEVDARAGTNTGLKTPATSLESSRKYADNTEKTPKKHRRNTEETPEKRQRNTKETPKKHQGNIKERLLLLLRERPDLSVRLMAEHLETTDDSVRHHLRVLQQESLVRRHGPTKGGYWEVVGEQD